jgi:ubiquinone/menaquinone biosynthesis C-methylase UbiE/DNA-binding transcriptional ArsR family regulator
VADSETLVSLLRAAGEETRLRLLTLLSDGEHSVKDLTEILGQSQPRVSRHLKLLADAGLVTRNAEGAWAYYGLAPNGAGGDLARWLIRRLEPADPDRQRDLKRLEAVRAAQQAQAAAYFAKVADSWDLLRSLHVPEEAVEAAILEALGDQVVDLLIDLGTGTGRMLELLKDHYRRGIGIDSSREMIAVARAKLAAASIRHAQIRLGDIGDLDAGLAGEADVVLIHQVLHYFDDPGKTLAQARRALKPGGEMLIVDFAPHELEFLRTHHAHRRLGLSEAQMTGWAKAARLAVSGTKCFPPANAEGLTVCLWRLRDEKDRTS